MKLISFLNNLGYHFEDYSTWMMVEKKEAAASKKIFQEWKMSGIVMIHLQIITNLK